MIDDARKLTIHFGERDRAGDGFLADALVDVFARHGLATSLVMRGTTGFGAKQTLRTDRLLTLSEDLPLVAVAVDRRALIEAAREDVTALRFDGLVTTERARLVAEGATPDALTDALHEETKLTVYLGRHETAGGRPAYEAVVEVLRRAGVAGATVLLGVDGTAHGVRHRARFVGTNAGVPLMVISVGAGPRVAAALPELGALLERPLMTVERIRVCKRDGARLADPRLDDAALHKLMVYASEGTRVGGDPLHVALVRRLRSARAAGATSVRGIWGYHGDHAPHGDRLLQLRRRVPVLTTIVDTPERMRPLFAVVDEITAATGLVTSEAVPVGETRHAD